MAKRNSKREPVKEASPPSEEEHEDELQELDLDEDESGSEGGEDDVGDEEVSGSDADDEGAEDEAGTSSGDGGRADGDDDDDDIDEAMLELMAQQAERAQRRAAARAQQRGRGGSADDTLPSSRSQGKSRMVAGAGPLDLDLDLQGEGEEGGGKGQDAGTRGQGAGSDASSDGDPDHPTAVGAGAEGHGVQGAGDPGSDSSEDERPNRNTVGAVPLEWYEHEDHIGYDIEGRAIAKSGKKDRLQQLLDRNDSKKALRTIYDPYNDEEITLTKEELAMVMRIRAGQFPHVEVNPFEPYNDYFSSEREVMPIVDRPEPKSRFVPSKWEEKKIIKLVRAIRKGWIKVQPRVAPEERPEPPAYLLWGDDGGVAGGEGQGPAGKSGSGLTYIPAPKPQLPGHADSYNPPAEYLPTEEEVSAWQLADPEDRPQALPQAFPSLRHVPAYADFVKERFERCLDLYLCPRVRRKRLDIKDPQQLVPQLPKPRDLQPFPTTLAMEYTGHQGAVHSVAPDPWTGQWLLSGGQDGTMRLWEVRSGRCMRTWSLGGPVLCVAWCPDPRLRLVCGVVGSSVVLLASGTGPEEAAEAAREALQVPNPAPGSSDGDAPPLATWSARPPEAAGDLPGLTVTLRFPLRHVAWHGRGDYFATVAPTGNTQAVVVHQLSRRASQNPFRKNRGRVVRVAFHPSKPFFFVATQNHVRVYNLSQQGLAKKLLGGGGAISCLAVHPGGDHVLVGSDDKRVAWYDMDLSNKPYKALRYHQQPPRSVAFHRTYPLFASSSDDGTVQVFHGMVYADLLTNPLIVPVKVLRGGHTVVASTGVTDCAFHPNQPWVFTAGADAKILLYVN